MSNYYLRSFKDILFMGNGQPGCTEAGILRLHRLLDDCLTEVGGLQQSPMGAEHPSGDPDGWEKESELGWKKVRDMVKDVAMALTGEEIKFSYDIAQELIDKETDKKFDDAINEYAEDKYPLRNPQHGEEGDFDYDEEEDEDDYVDNHNEEDEYLEEDTIKVTSADLINALDKVCSDPGVQRGLAFCKRIMDDARKNLK